jgi:hypothetical protein
MCDTNTFGPKWLNENIVNDGVSIHLVGQSYPDSNPNKGDDLFLQDPSYNLSSILGFLNYDISFNIILDKLMENNGEDFFSNTNLPYSVFLSFVVKYIIGNSNSGFQNSIFYNFLHSSSNPFDIDSTLKLVSAINNDIPKNTSSDRLVTCDFLYRRDIIQNFTTNLLCDPRNRLCIGSPLLLPYMLDLSSLDLSSQYLSSQYLSSQYEPSIKESINNEFNQLIALFEGINNDNRYRFPLIPDSIKVQIPQGLQLGSIFNTQNSGYILDDRIDLSSNIALIPAQIVVPPGVYQIIANIPLEIPNDTEINNYSAVIYEYLNFNYNYESLDLSTNIIIGNTITSVSSEKNVTGRTIIKKIQLVDQVAVTNTTAYFLTLNFNFTGSAALLCNSASGFKFQAMKIA